MASRRKDPAAPRGRIRDGLRLLRLLGSSTSGLPSVEMFPEGEDIMRWSAVGRHYVVSRSPRHVEQVFVEGYDTYQKATHYRLLATVTGQGLLTSEGEAWERQRRLIQPVLGRRQIDGLVPAMVAATGGYLDRFTPPAPPTPVLLTEEMTEVTLDVVGRALFGSGLSHHIDRLRPAVSQGMAIALTAARLQMMIGFSRRMIDLGGRLVRRVPLPPPLNRIRRVMTTFDDVVTVRIEQREQAGPGDAGDLLDLLLTVTDEHGQPMDRDTIRDELVTMMLAGHETTANALSWLWYLLTQHPDAYERHLDEVRTVLGDREPTADDIEQLVWTRACLQEAMRLYPPAWVLEREAKVATDLDGYAIPRKATVIFLVHLIHRDARWWDDPSDFRPERFLPDAPRPRRGTYLPFGAGRRVCVAASFALTEGTLIAAMISQRHRFERTDPGPPGESATVTLRPADGLPMLVTPSAGRAPDLNAELAMIRGRIRPAFVASSGRLTLPALDGPYPGSVRRVGVDSGGVTMRFVDRADAGRALVEPVAALGLTDPLVLGLPRGGVPVAAELAQALGAPLDVFVARKVGAPSQVEFGIGAVAEGGIRVADRSVLAQLGISEDEFARLAAREEANVVEFVDRYRSDRPLPDLAGADVVVVDDGLATGMTARAALKALREMSPSRLVFAVPVGARDSVERLSEVADVVVCAVQPSRFEAVGTWYEDFRATADDEVLRHLNDRAGHR